MIFTKSWLRGFEVRRFAPLIVMLLFPALLQADWREDLLKERGIALDKASLRKAAKSDLSDAETYRKAFKQLSSDEFAEREQGQRILSDAGAEVLDFLESREPIEDPEVRFRVAEIRQAHTAIMRTRMAPMIRFAAKSLLEQPKAVNTGGRYFEWFGTQSKDCRQGYRQLSYEGPEDVKAQVHNGRLLIPAGNAVESDQRLVLAAKTWPGEEKLPQKVRVSCLVGGGPGGAGTWHVALSVGKAKALFHPGYRSGAFRFEQADSHEKISTNRDMGFTPKPGHLQRMELLVTRLPNDKVSFKVVISSPANERFEHEMVMTAAEVGELDRIGLERSGRHGGDAIFDDLQIEILP